MKSYKPISSGGGEVDLGDEETVGELTEKAKIARDQEVHEMKEVLETYGGRATVWRIIAWCGLMQAVPADTNAAFRDIGKKDVGQRLLNEVFTSAPDAYMVMRQEAQEREEDG